MPETEQESMLSSLLGKGELAGLLARYNWAESPVGTPERWPAHFRVTLVNLVHSAFPMLILWGPDLLVFYNDAYRPTLGNEGKHPGILGRPAREAYSEVWSIVGPMLEQVQQEGISLRYDDQPTPFYRNGRLEEVLWTFSYSPVLSGEGAVDGVLVICSETTQKVRRINFILNQAHALMAILKGADFIIEEANDSILRAWGVDANAIGQPVLAAVPSLNEQVFGNLLRQVYETGSSYYGFEQPFWITTASGEQSTHYYNFEYSAYREHGSSITGVIILAYDVTGQVLERQQRAIAEQEVQSAIAAADLGYWNVDPMGKTLKCNRRTRELFGLPLDVEDVDLSVAILAIHDEDRDRVVDTIARTLSDPAQSSYNIKYRVNHPFDGQVHYVHAIGKSYFDDSGKAYHFSGIIQDVTQGLLAEEELRRSEQRFQAAIEAVHGVLWTNNAEGKMEGEQPGWSSLTGQSRAEYEGYGWATAVHPDDAEATVKAWGEAVRDKRNFVFQHRLRRSDGSWGQYSIHAVPILDSNNSIREWVGVHTDITEQRRAEEALRRSERQLRELADLMPQIVWSTDAAGYHDFYNERWYRYTGLTYEQSKNEGWSLVLHPDDAARTWQVWNHSLQTGDVYEVEYRMRRHDGEYRWLLARATPVRNEEGVIVRWFGTCTDIHDQKSFAETLEHLVAERTRELQRSNDDLQQFAHVASHDLKEPVRKIATFESRISHDFGDQLPERARDYLEKIRNAARRMYTMIEGVLRYSSLNEGEQASEPVDLNELLAQIISDLEVVIAEKGARIEGSDMPLLKGSPTLLYQLFYNIINNALKFAAPGRPPLVRITAESLPGAVCIRVADNGIGFDPAHATRIFKTFTRLHPKDRYEGTGLGLALSQKIVDRHGGSISAEGIEGEGATFIITLPV
jgi:PAS domain S-box-containing protein